MRSAVDLPDLHVIARVKMDMLQLALTIQMILVTQQMVEPIVLVFVSAARPKHLEHAPRNHLNALKEVSAIFLQNEDTSAKSTLR